VLKNLLAGGDVLSPRHVRVARKELTECRIINGYGPTENTTFTCCGPVAQLEEGVPVPIGRPLDNTKVYLLDQDLQPVPVGVIGELYTTGDGLARGYLRRPELTAEKFIPNPYGDSGTRLYRVGDLARYLPNGEIVFAGRTDQQIKLRGFRIELGEIETVIEQQPQILHAAVVVHEDETKDKRLVGYVVTQKQITSDELREALKPRLPDYMIPSIFMMLESLPLTASGKIDRKALPAPALDGTARQQSYVAPRTETETRIAQIWSEVLGVVQVGVEEDFFSLGGHSLLATRVISRVNTAFGIDVSLRRVFEEPTIARLAAVVEQAKTSEIQPSEPALVRVARAAVSWPTHSE
jgi:aspartate racemase